MEEPTEPPAADPQDNQAPRPSDPPPGDDPQARIRQLQRQLRCEKAKSKTLGCLIGLPIWIGYRLVFGKKVTDSVNDLREEAIAIAAETGELRFSAALTRVLSSPRKAYNLLEAMFLWSYSHRLLLFFLGGLFGAIPSCFVYQQNQILTAQNTLLNAQTLAANSQASAANKQNKLHERDLKLAEARERTQAKRDFDQLWRDLYRGPLERKGKAFLALLSRDEKRLRGVSLNDTLDLSGRDLRGVDLSGSDLGKQNLRKSDLRGATLSGANLASSDLRGADLRNARLDNLSLYRADLRGAKLGGAILRGAKLQECNLRGLDLRHVDMGLRGTHFNMCDLREADLRGVALWRVYFEWSDFRKADLRGADLRTPSHMKPKRFALILGNAKWNGAKIDSTTRLPKEFPREKMVEAGAVLQD